MIIRLLLFGIFFTTMTSASAVEYFMLNFELTQGKNIIAQGRTFVSKKPHSWSKGLKRSYLKLRCDKRESGKMQQSYSTVDYFAGLSVTHQLVENSVELTVVRDVVQSRLSEIRALTKSECKDMSPIVTTTTQTYSFSAIDGHKESLPFGENMIFRTTLQSVVRVR